ncbi:hypothetical protein [Herbiconiux sp. L3-i23]|uniref:hypothetical protein n=1 Tax=Herbiconiux sp. L3-i23 TaxID=2905871 RepID=UPI00204DD9DF|nr:hypothetical protein [Herbiconiux sp. L3-i23]BDI22117.1 hypothetical protein L3i23_08930 [Herbiconiux sp. L3-i23]
MELGTLGLLYVPFLAFMLIGIAVAFDGRTRVSRPRGTRIVGGIQIAAGLVMALAAVGGIVVSPQVGLFPGIDLVSTRATVWVYLVAGIISVVTLLVGLARPADPHPRRGLTGVALVLDAIAVAGCLYYLYGPPSAVTDAVVG